MFDKMMVRGLLAAIVLASAVSVRADVFNMGGTISGGTWTGVASLQFVTVGDPGNVADPATGGTLGSVGYTYQMGKYDVTLGQYTAFLNAVAKTDTYGLYDTYMGTDYGTQGIKRTGSLGSYSYSVTGSNPQAANCPVFDVNWGDAARFCNWLQNSQGTATTVAAAYALTETGAYTLSGGTSAAALMVTRNAGAIYVIPTENEWYKAAYYNPSSGTYTTYATNSNLVPANSLALTSNDANYNHTDPTNYLTPVGYFSTSPSAYGTFDQSGDVWQWNEANFFGSFRGLRGGSWNNTSGGVASSSYSGDIPTNEHDYVGFRVASVPEPGSIALLLAGAVGLLAYAWRPRHALSHAWDSTHSSDDDGPAILSMPSRCQESVRRAA